MTLEEQVAELRRRMDVQERERVAAAERVAALEKQVTAHQKARVTPATALLLLVVLGLTVLCGSRAYAVASVPNHTEFAITVPANFNSAPWSLPVSDSPVTVNICCNNDYAATSFVKITHHSHVIPGVQALTWVGLHAYAVNDYKGVATGYTDKEDVVIVEVGEGHIAQLLSHANAGKLNQLLVHVNNDPRAPFPFVVEMIW